MALSINEVNNVFKVKGSINTNTAQNFQKHLEMVIKTQDGLTIDINDVMEIDKRGLDAIKSLYDYALQYRREFYILGNGCKEIYDDFKAHFSAA